MLKYQEDSEDVKVGLGELREQLETPEEAGVSIMQIAKQARKERGKSSSRSSGKKRMRCTSPERRCQDVMQEVKLLSEATRSAGWNGGE